MRIFCLVLSIIVLLSFSACAEDDSGAKEAIKNLFPGLQTYTTETGVSEGRDFRIYRIFSEGRIIGWAVVLDEMGKIKPITFLVGIDAQGKVAGVNVLEYRDMFGSEIKRRSFLRQFQGKSLKDRIHIGADIDAVTSATISSQAAAAAVKKALNLIEKSYKQN